MQDWDEELLGDHRPQTAVEGDTKKTGVLESTAVQHNKHLLPLKYYKARPVIQLASGTMFTSHIQCLRHQDR